jgi:hypothetical protein
LDLLQLAVEEIEDAPAIIAPSQSEDVAAKVRIESLPGIQVGRLATVHTSRPRMGAVVDDGSIPSSVEMDCRKATNRSGQILNFFHLGLRFVFL